MTRGSATIVLTSSSDIERTRIRVAPRSAMITSQATSSGSCPRSRASSSIVLPGFRGRRVGDADVRPGLQPAEIRKADFRRASGGCGRGYRDRRGAPASHPSRPHGSRAAAESAADWRRCRRDTGRNEPRPRALRAASTAPRSFLAPPQLSMPESFRWAIWTWIPQLSPMSMASATASWTACDSSRICDE